ncbi:hypothetical protein STEG23_036645 [Scotinomys teguina]
MSDTKVSDVSSLFEMIPRDGLKSNQKGGSIRNDLSHYYTDWHILLGTSIAMHTGSAGEPPTFTDFLSLPGNFKEHRDVMEEVGDRIAALLSVICTAFQPLPPSLDNFTSEADTRNADVSVVSDL